MNRLATTALLLRRYPALRRTLQAGVVALVLLFFALGAYSLAPQLLAYRWSLDPAYMLLTLVLVAMRGPVSVWGWWLIMRKLGYPLRFARSIRIAYHSALARYLPGQMWYAVSRVYLAEKEGVPRLITAVSIGLETAMLVIGAGLVSSLSLIAWRSAPLWVAAVVVFLLVALVARPRLVFSLLNWALARIGRPALDVNLTRRDMLELLVPFTAMWLHFGLLSFALTASLYPSLEWSLLPPLAGLFTAAWLIGFLTVVVPQGFVIREGLIITFLTTLLGVPVPVATAAALLSRAWSMLGEVAWAGISTRF